LQLNYASFSRKAFVINGFKPSYSSWQVFCFAIGIEKGKGMKNKHLAEEVFRYVLKIPEQDFAHLTIKLLRAERQLLRDQSLTVKALASNLGYADYQYFIARFKEHWGESPGRYRKLVG
jgi:hypothetical protein